MSLSARKVATDWNQDFQILTKVPIDFGIDWSWSSVSFLISNLLFTTKLCVSYSFTSFCIYLVRTSPVSVLHPTWPRTYTDSYARGQCLAMDRETVYFEILVRPLEFGHPRRGDWHWVLQAAIGFRPIICASHIDILYANIRQSPKHHKTASISLYFVPIATWDILHQRNFWRGKRHEHKLCHHGIPCSLFHILTSFVHVGPIGRLTNRPCHGPWNVIASRRFCSVSSSNVVSGVSGWKI